MKKDMIRNALTSFKNLSKSQADALIIIIKQQKKLTKTEIVNLLDKENISNKQTAYRLLNELVTRKVLFIDNNYYQPINTRMLIDDCNNSLTLMETEIEGLEITADWEKSDPSNRAKIIVQEHEIIHEIYGIQSQNCDMYYYYKENDNNLSFWKTLKERFNGIKLEKGTYNCIVFINKDNKPFESGVIILSKRVTKQGANQYYGSLIFDEELPKKFMKKRGKDE